MEKEMMSEELRGQSITDLGRALIAAHEAIENPPINEDMRDLLFPRTRMGKGFTFTACTPLPREHKRKGLNDE